MHPFRALHIYACDRDAWEDVCARCGRCCFEREVGADGQVALNYAAPCEHLDLETHRCRVYPRRFELCAACHRLTPATALFSRHLPAECAYRKAFRG